MMSGAGGWPMGDMESSSLPIDGTSPLASNLVSFEDLLSCLAEEVLGADLCFVVEDDPETIN